MHPKKKNKRINRHLETPFQFHPKLTKYLFVTSALFLALRIIVALISQPGMRIWGLDYPKYILSWDVWFALLIPFLACFPSIAQKTAIFFAQSNKKSSKVRYWFYAALITGTLVVFANNFNVLYSFLGDGSYCHAEIYRVNNNPDMHSPLFDKPTAYFTGQIFRFLAIHFDFSETVAPFRLVGLISLIIFIPTLFYFFREEQKQELALFISIAMFNPAILFFFGYVELYALQYVFLCFYLASVYYTLKHNSSPFIPLVLLLLSIGFGGSSVVYLAGAVFLILVHFIPKAKRTFAMLSIIALQIAAFTGIAFYQWDEMLSPHIIPIFSGEVIRPEGLHTGWYFYSLFSIAHIADIFNIILFSLGILAPIGLLLVITERKSGMWQNTLVQLGAITAVSSLLLLLGGNASYGIARDWDLMMIATIGIAFFTITVLMAAHIHKRISLNLLLPVILLTSLSTSYIWVKLNAVEESATRLEHITDMDSGVLLPNVTCNGYENIRKYCLRRGLLDLRARMLRKMIATKWDRYDHFREATYNALRFTDPQKTAQELDWIIREIIAFNLESYPSNDYRYFPADQKQEFLASTFILIAAQKEDFVDPYLDIAHEQLPIWKQYEFVRASINLDAKMSDITPLIKEAVPLGSKDPQLVSTAGAFYRSIGNYALAVDYYERTLELDPHNFDKVYIMLAKVYVVLKNREKAIATLERCIENCKLSINLPEAKQLLKAVHNYNFNE